MSLIVAEYRCPSCGVFEVLIERPAPDKLTCGECGELGEWTISAPKPKALSVPAFAAVRGGDMKDRPPGMLDTRDLGEGKLTHREWRAKQDAARQERRHKQLIAKGIKKKRIQVG